MTGVADLDSPAVVTTDGGAVTLVDLAGLRTRVGALKNQADSLTTECRSLRTLAEGLWIQRGQMLLMRTADWSVPPQLAEVIRQAAVLKEQEEADDAKLESILNQERHGVGGLLGNVADWSGSRKATADRAKADSQLHPLLVQIGQQAPDVTVPEADSVRAQALAAAGQAREIESQAAATTASANSANDEVKRRIEAEREMGFDAPYLAASLQTHGPQAIASPLILKWAEQASVAVPATLARQQTRRQYVGGSQGFSFPIGHTGIRYRVGSFRGHAVEQQSLGRLDSGTLVVTNQRLAFMGSTKSTSVVFAKLLHVECYSDALAVFQEGREKADYYYVAQPKYVLFFINWFLNQAAA
jgi:hypothetical protein